MNHTNAKKYTTDHIPLCSQVSLWFIVNGVPKAVVYFCFWFLKMHCGGGGNKTSSNEPITSSGEWARPRLSTVEESMIFVLQAGAYP